MFLEHRQLAGETDDEDESEDESDTEEDAPSPSDGIPARTVLDASTYISAYYSLGLLNADAGADVDEVDALPLMDQGALIDAWPGWKQKPSGSGEALPIAANRNPTLPDQHTSLREKAMSEVIFRALESEPDDLEWVSDAEQLHDFADVVRAKLAAKPDLVGLPSGISLHRRAYKDHSPMDLTPFDKLSAIDALSIVDEARNGTDLLLPALDALTSDILGRMLDSGKLAELHLGPTKRLSLLEILDAIKGKGLNSFTHSELFRRSLEMAEGFSKEAYGVQYSSMTSRGTVNILPQAPILPTAQFPCGVDAGFPVAQMVYLRHHIGSRTVRVSDGVGLRWSQCDTEDLLDGQAAACPAIVAMDLRDALLSAHAVLRKLPAAVQKLRPLRAHDFNWFKLPASGVGFGKQLALSSGDTALPLPGELSRSWRKMGRSSAELPPKALTLSHGQYTLFVLHEKSSDDFEAYSKTSIIRYGFATLNAESELVCLSAKDSLLAMNAHDPSTSYDRLSEFEFKLDYNGEAFPTLSVSVCTAEEAKEAVGLLEIFNGTVGEREQEWRRRGWM